VAVLPMPAEYQSMLESRVADLKNITSSKFGGAITAAMFLREFVGDTPWAHFDIAGPSYFTRSYLPYWGVGGSGWGVRTLLHYLKNLSAR
jgi:leucyl aminopeptidase